MSVHAHAYQDNTNVVSLSDVRRDKVLAYYRHKDRQVFSLVGISVTDKERGAETRPLTDTSGQVVGHYDPLQGVFTLTRTVRFTDAHGAPSCLTKGPHDLVYVVAQSQRYTEADTVTEMYEQITATETKSNVDKELERLRTRREAQKLLEAEERETTVLAAYLEHVGKHLDKNGEAVSSFEPVDPDSLSREEKLPTIGHRSDGVNVFYPGKTYDFHANPGVGKSMAAQVFAAQIILDGGNVLYIDYEDDPADVYHRIHSMGVDWDETLRDRTRFAYISPTVHTAEDKDAFVRLLAGNEWTFIVIDGVNKSMQLIDGFKIESTTDVNMWMDDLPRACAATGAAVVQIDHTAKTSDGSTSMGSQAKTAGLTGAAFYIKELEPLGRGHRGVLGMFSFKDRQGWFRQHGETKDASGGTHFADIVVDSRDEKHIKAEVKPNGQGRADYTDPASRNPKQVKSGADLALATYLPRLSGTQRAYVASVRALDNTDAKTVTNDDIYATWQELWPGDCDGSKSKMARELSKAKEQGALRTYSTGRFKPLEDWHPARCADETKQTIRDAVRDARK